ncbi:hypothetical protein [Streptomyces sp. NPDC059928]|uniref:hypothetical protein n=1 Tax=unclassified Streptomyces TaxID=2593676 RepID=UPI00364F2428
MAARDDQGVPGVDAAARHDRERVVPLAHHGGGLGTCDDPAEHARFTGGRIAVDEWAGDVAVDDRGVGLAAAQPVGDFLGYNNRAFPD